MFSIDTVDAFMYAVNRSIVDIFCFPSFLSAPPDNESNNCISLRIVFDNEKFYLMEKYSIIVPSEPSEISSFDIKIIILIDIPSILHFRRNVHHLYTFNRMRKLFINTICKNVLDDVKFLRIEA